uniref:Uncharacterized protein n=1 Tax=Romanomermis culicivorax TaxID=13658 RepID=A0A915K9B3_ROMCU
MTKLSYCTEQLKVNGNGSSGCLMPNFGAIDNCPGSHSDRRGSGHCDGREGPSGLKGVDDAEFFDPYAHNPSQDESRDVRGNGRLRLVVIGLEMGLETLIQSKRGVCCTNVYGHCNLNSNGAKKIDQNHFLQGSCGSKRNAVQAAGVAPSTGPVKITNLGCNKAVDIDIDIKLLVGNLEDGTDIEAMGRNEVVVMEGGISSRMLSCTALRNWSVCG